MVIFSSLARLLCYRQQFFPCYAFACLVSAFVAANRFMLEHCNSAAYERSVWLHLVQMIFYEPPHLKLILSVRSLMSSSSVFEAFSECCIVTYLENMNDNHDRSLIHSSDKLDVIVRPLVLIFSKWALNTNQYVIISMNDRTKYHLIHNDTVLASSSASFTEIQMYHTYRMT